MDGLERALLIMLAGVHGDIDEVRKYRDIALAVGLLGGLIVAVAGGLLLRLSAGTRSADEGAARRVLDNYDLSTPCTTR